MLGYRGSQLEFSDQWIAAIARTSNGQVFFSSQMCQRWSSGKMVRFVRARVFREQIADAYIYIHIQIIWITSISASYHQHRNRFPLKIFKQIRRLLRSKNGPMAGINKSPGMEFRSLTDWRLVDFGGCHLEISDPLRKGSFLKQGNLKVASLDFMKMVGVVRCSPAGGAEPSWMCQEFFRSLISKGVK